MTSVLDDDGDDGDESGGPLQMQQLCQRAHRTEVSDIFSLPEVLSQILSKDFCHFFLLEFSFLKFSVFLAE